MCKRELDCFGHGWNSSGRSGLAGYGRNCALLHAAKSMCGKSSRRSRSPGNWKSPERGGSGLVGVFQEYLLAPGANKIHRPGLEAALVELRECYGAF
jgi:hypothetical protein